MANLGKMCCRLLGRQGSGQEESARAKTRGRGAKSKRSGRGRWLVGLGLFLGAFPFLTTTPVQAASCADVAFVFARGSGEAVNGSNYQAWLSAMRSAAAARSNLKYAYYELGNTGSSFKYPAVAVGFDSLRATITTLGAVVDARGADSFNASVETGVSELLALVNNNATTCPDTQWVLGGYSQGAMVVSLALQHLSNGKVFYAATFGDPQLYLPEGAPRWFADPLACSGESLSIYRVSVPDCTTYQGILGGLIPYVRATLAGRTGVWCYDRDLICGSQMQLSNLMGAHTAYQNGGYGEAADKVAKLLKSSFVSTDEQDTEDTGDSGSTQEDTGQSETEQTYSEKEFLMILDLSSLTEEFTIQDVMQNLVTIRTVADEYSSRIALYVVGGQNDAQMRKLFNYDTGLTEALAAIDTLADLASSDLWTGSFTYDSTAVAIMAAVQDNVWASTSAYRSVLIYSANPIVANGKLSEIDTILGAPVEIGADLFATFLSLGSLRYCVFHYLGEMLLRYDVNFPKTTTSSLSAATATTATATALLATSTTTAAASIDGLSALITGDTATVKIAASDAALVLVVLDGALLGMATTEEITLENLSGESTLTLIPYNSDGERGNTRSLVLPATTDAETLTVQSGTLAGATILAPNTGVASPLPALAPGSSTTNLLTRDGWLAARPF